MERWRTLGIIGGIAGLASIFMPWFTMSAQGLLNFNLGFSPVDFLRIAGSNGASSSGSNLTSPSSSALAATVWLVFVGGIVVTVGSLIAILYRLRGGILILGGAFLGLVGGLAAPYVTVSTGEIVSMGPSWGVGVAFVAGFVVLSGIWVREPEPTHPPEARAADATSEVEGDLKD